MKIKYQVKTSTKIAYWATLAASVIAMIVYLVVRKDRLFSTDEWTRNTSWILIATQVGLFILLQSIYVSQKRLKRAMILIIFTDIFYYLSFITFTMEVDVSRIINGLFMVDNNIKQIGHYSSNVIGIMTTYQLFLSLILMQILILIFLTYDFIMWKVYLKKETTVDNISQQRIYKMSVINLISTIIFSALVFWALQSILGRFLIKLFNENLILQYKASQVGTYNYVVSYVNSLWRILELVSYPLLTISSSLLRGSAVGDNFTIKNVGFKFKVLVLFSWDTVLSGSKLDTLFVIGLTYAAYSCIYILINLVVYFSEGIDNTIIPINIAFPSEREMANNAESVFERAFKHHSIFAKLLPWSRKKHR